MSETGLGVVPIHAIGASAAWPDVGERSATGSYGYAVPRRFLWLTDLLIQILALFAAQTAAPLVQRLVAPGSLLAQAWISSWLSLPGAADLGDFRPLGEVLWIPVVMVPTTMLFVDMLGGYRPLLGQSRARILVSSVVAPTLGLSVVTLVLIAGKYHRASRAFIFLLALLTAFGLLAYRWAVRAYKLRRLRSGHYARNIVAVGTPATAGWLAAHFKRNVSDNVFRLTGYLAAPQLSVPSPPGMAAQESPALPSPVLLGSVDSLGDLLVHRPIHEVIAVQSSRSGVWLKTVIEQCDYFRVCLRIVPEELLQWRPHDLDHVFRGPLRLPEIVLSPRHLDSDALFVKRVLDILVSATLLILLSPLFLLVAIAIKLTTPHLPVFYPWRVVGYKGRSFTGYKFTTMEADADQRKSELMHLNEMNGPVFKIQNDPRITRIGRVLRRYSVNEFPQLWSVLKGDMSLVGPRPAYPSELARYELWHKRKLCVQPGITCLWQIGGRNKISDFDDWVRMDFEYMDNWSLWMDCRILARTVWAVVRGTGA
jgi:exopolysaccharide biosynthesis polyprenyl glycosylphosphotransferase